ncbi:MAG TPA: BatA and WFA domain-containing protein, partial [Pirellulales bacterium]|nr:BatA and WFA domain-containing protein [Pirellulales bacterium]
MWPEWTSMLGTWQWAALAAVPPLVIALYFLKLKRHPLEVPSTYLWRKSLEDLHVNSLWQRLRRSLLLWLQLLLIAALMLAAGRPSWTGSRLEGGRYVFLVDNSASMQARDVLPSRLDEAKRIVAGLIDEMGSADVAMIVVFSDAAQVAQSFTANRQQLHQALAAIRPTNRTTSLADALRVAGGLANAGRSADHAHDLQPSEALPTKLFVASDGRFDAVQDFALGNLDPVFIPIGKREVDNQAIVSLGASTPPTSGHSQLYARIENFNTQQRTREVSLYVDGELVDAQQVELPAGRSHGVAFELETAGPATVELRLDGSDELAADDRAWKVLEARRRADVLLISPGNEPLALVLATQDAQQRARVRQKTPAYLDSAEYAQEAAGDELDLVIYDRCLPQSMPQANTLFIGRLPPDGRWHAAAPVSAPQIVDVNAAHPLMHLVELGNVLLAEATPLKPPPGGVSLIDAGEGPILAIAPREVFEDCVLGFEIVGQDQAQTNWPLKNSFPVFAWNLLEYFGSRGHQRTSVDLRPGQIAVLAPATTASSLEMKLPGGRHERVTRDKDRVFRFADTGDLGIYELDASPAAAARFAVNLLDAAESNIAERSDQDIKIGQVMVSGQLNWRSGRHEAWRWLVLA